MNTPRYQSPLLKKAVAQKVADSNVQRLEGEIAQLKAEATRKTYPEIVQPKYEFVESKDIQAIAEGIKAFSDYISGDLVGKKYQDLGASFDGIKQIISGLIEAMNVYAANDEELSKGQKETIDMYKEVIAKTTEYQGGISAEINLLASFIKDALLYTNELVKSIPQPLPEDPEDEVVDRKIVRMGSGRIKEIVCTYRSGKIATDKIETDEKGQVIGIKRIES